MVEKSKGVVTTIVILVLIILGLIVYICYDKGVIFSKDDTNTTTTNNTNETNNENTMNNNETTNTNEIKDLDLSKSLNTKDITYKNASDQEGNYGLSMKVNNDKTVTLTIDWKIFGKFSTTGSSGEIKDYIVKGFTKNIKSTFIGDLGQSYNGITLFFIMEDGSVEYTKMFKQAENNNTDGSIYYVLNNTILDNNEYAGEFISSGTLSGVNGIIKLYNVDTYSQNASGYRTVIGATKDGSFYDLGSIINK